MKKSTLLLASWIITIAALPLSLSAWISESDKQLNENLEHYSVLYGNMDNIKSVPQEFQLYLLHPKIMSPGQPIPRHIGDLEFWTYTSEKTKIVLTNLKKGTKKEYPITEGTYKMRYDAADSQNDYTIEINISKTQKPIRVSASRSFFNLWFTQYEDTPVYIIKVNIIWKHPEHH